MAPEAATTVQARVVEVAIRRVKLVTASRSARDA